MRYLSYLDGLRAVAIAPVVLYHLSPVLMPAGFLGVDVFFVLSGFLITGIIDREIAERRFSLLSFWERRVRRLLPAAASVLVASFVASYFLMGPHEAVEFSESLIAAAFFHANFHFAETLDYFAAPAEHHPLLHFWSLSIEEQFYFIWPASLALLTLARRRSLIHILLAAICLASLGYAQWGTPAEPGAFFYNLGARAWELGMGALLALNIDRLKPGRRQAEIAAFAGAILILGSMSALGEEYRVPGLLTLPVTIGVILVIGAGFHRETIVTRALSAPAMVGVGLLSYSLYLWHWPVLSFARLSAAEPLGWAQLAGLLLLACVLSYLSWRFIERPVRKWRWAKTAKQQGAVIAGGLFALLTASGLAVAMEQTKGMPWRLPGDQARLYTHMGTMDPYVVRCEGWRQAMKNNRFCNVGAPYDPEHGFDALIVGSSHANQFAPALEEWAKREGIAVRQVTNTTCSGVRGVIRPNYARKQMCIDYHAEIQKVIENSPNLKLLIIANHFDFSGEERRAAFAEAHQSYIAWAGARGLRIHFISRIPMDMPVRAPCAIAAMSDPTVASQCGRERDRRIDPIDNFYRGMADGYDHVTASFPSRHLCSETHCRLVADGIFLYKNRGHLNAHGARWLGPRLDLPSLAQHSSK